MVVVAWQDSVNLTGRLASWGSVLFVSLTSRNRTTSLTRSRLVKKHLFLLLILNLDLFFNR
jgi:hypothetical protein